MSTFSSKWSSSGDHLWINYMSPSFSPMTTVVSEVFLRYRCARVWWAYLCSLQVAFVLLYVCVRNVFRPQHLEVALLACAGVCLPLLGVLVANNSTKIGFRAVDGGAFKSYCLGAAQGPNTKLPNFVLFKNVLLGQICLGCRISHYILAHSSEFSNTFQMFPFWRLQQFALNCLLSVGF